MDNEFWEQRDDTYKERHQYLKDELKTVEQGTHSAFEDAILDIEVRKEQTIECAENFKDYELSLINYQYEMEVNLLQEEYRTEKNGLQTLMLQTIAEKRKLIKEDKEDYEVNDVFDEAYKKIAKNKRILRKKSNLYERHASPSRLERRKQNRTQMLYNIHAAPSSVEQEELEADLLQMKIHAPQVLRNKTTKNTAITSSIQCDCGFQDNLTTTWSDVWHMNFQNRPSPSNLYAINDLFFANYIIEAKYNDSYARIFHKENVNTLEDAIQIAITVNQTSNEIICGGFGTTRSFMKSTSVNGSVASMFAYHPQGEIDIEIVSALHPPQAYFAVHPGLTVQSRASPLTHGNWFFSFDPSLDYHEYRFDWLPGLTIFYVDGIERYRMTTNILNQPSRIMFNHWTDGNIKFSQGPVKQDASLYIKNMTFFFNSTDTQPSCLVTNQACKVQGNSSFKF
ncbi:hypothetical protein G6F37_010683 [Rhizopus arrhizus]|nr:hypothetical protein G6F38_010681 [Rhizopus arrhizus]KAG1153073.1 hypothetical protein G6F37_010683 [Rhizopus arrhizus]